MSIGSSLFADKLDDNYLVPVTCDAPSGSLNHQATLTFLLPVSNLDEVWAEQGLQGAGASKRSLTEISKRPWGASALVLGNKPHRIF